MDNPDPNQTTLTGQSVLSEEVGLSFLKLRRAENASSLGPVLPTHDNTVSPVITATTFPSAFILTATSVLCVGFTSFVYLVYPNHDSLIWPTVDFRWYTTFCLDCKQNRQKSISIFFAAAKTSGAHCPCLESPNTRTGRPKWLHPWCSAACALEARI